MFPLVLAPKANTIFFFFRILSMYAFVLLDSTNVAEIYCSFNLITFFNFLFPQILQ